MKYINIKGYLFDLDEPVVMGILNVTPDSFYAESRKQNRDDIDRRITTILHEGGKIIDIGGYSSRPGAAHVSDEEERQRLKPGLDHLKKYFPDVIVSIDTFRADIACWAVEEYGVAIVNDISGGGMDEKMFQTIARLQVPYILTHLRGTPQMVQQDSDYNDMIEEMMLFFADKLHRMQLLGVNDIILDPGFGFGKTVDQNYELMRTLPEFQIFERPLLVGVSRKRMIYDFLECDIEDSLSGTTVLHTFALIHGANILRVHDVIHAVEAVKIISKLKK
ncbi:MAG: dihydropteroate synthase [Tannerella sp.]|jgi:dihydropteroate synthase|nr:dihydropteroate synthase [Tannerella sp.]